MLRHKVETRATDGGGPIDVLDFKPAVVRGHRLAFNFRGYAPLEPAVAGLDPEPGSECHGALIRLTAAEYERLWLSEGGGQPDTEYEEVCITCYPYGDDQQPVQAVALRARPHARLSVDACPSARYMSLLIDGAKELRLAPEYIAALEATQTQQVSPPLLAFAVHHLFFVHALFQLRLHWLVHAWSTLLWRAYVPSSHPSELRRAAGNGATAALLAPGAALGVLIRAFMWWACIPPPPVLAKYASMRPGCSGCS